MKLRTYCLACREHTDNIGSKRVTMTNEGVLSVCLINQSS